MKVLFITTLIALFLPLTSWSVVLEGKKAFITFEDKTMTVKTEKELFRQKTSFEGFNAFEVQSNINTLNAHILSGGKVELQSKKLNSEVPMIVEFGQAHEKLMKSMNLDQARKIIRKLELEYIKQKAINPPCKDDGTRLGWPSLEIYSYIYGNKKPSPKKPASKKPASKKSKP